eukprot:Anaeramoba_ignava/a5875_7.p1 GENE.a5875_7~~a5875_7.p1  ORF type:complete len:176 (-),score=52.16 a5875_7:280-807(-)
MIGKVLRARWAIDQKLGQGAFGEIYSAQDLDTDTKVAIKVEKKAPKRETLKIEVSVMKRFQKSSYSADFISCGRFDDYYYVVMDLLGPNLAELKRKTQKGRFSLATTMKLGIEMISSIEDIHEIGYIHRDIKSSNFLMCFSSKCVFLFTLSIEFFCGVAIDAPTSINKDCISCKM